MRVDPYSYRRLGGGNAGQAHVDVYLKIHGPQPNNTVWLNMSFSDEVVSADERHVGGGFPPVLGMGAASDYQNRDGGNKGGQFFLSFHGVQFLREYADNTTRKVRVTYWDNDDHQLCIYDVACGQNENDTEVEAVTHQVERFSFAHPVDFYTSLSPP